ncbi:hypothetical protein LP52_03300 [Streptomonospora alba]|uniref:Subtilisin inhibitor domain-containing protein n=1 Tax=Streptomonospora alba TaxID=183763 RepID=A0A0C2JM11_9ACTN|nr:hypothetical protein [Streptomonospora alba]KIH99995.1 hypothetical protein LP52_03300 [Streptomonospora alba]
MVKLNPRRGVLGSVGTTILGSLCLGGALAYGVAVGGSLMAPEPEAATESAVNNTVSDVGSAPPEPPVGELRIKVVDEGRAYVQNLTCEGDPATDPDACAEMARVAAEWAEGASQGSADNPFVEVAEDAVCTDRSYGPQEAAITGTWQGREIETEVDRSDSCQEARWQRLRPVTAPLD